MGTNYPGGWSYLRICLTLRNVPGLVSGTPQGQDPLVAAVLIPLEQLGDRGAGFFGHSAETNNR
jgi:hypothetical protein